MSDTDRLPPGVRDRAVAAALDALRGVYGPGPAPVDQMLSADAEIVLDAMLPLLREALSGEIRAAERQRAAAAVRDIPIPAFDGVGAVAAAAWMRQRAQYLIQHPEEESRHG